MFLNYCFSGTVNSSVTMQPHSPTRGSHGIEFPLVWSKTSAFERPPAKSHERASNSVKSFMIEDILREGDKEESKEEAILQEENGLVQHNIAATRPLWTPFHRIPEYTYAGFPPTHPQVLSQAIGSESQNRIPYDLPKYFRTFLNESRRFRRIRTVFTRVQLQEMEDRFVRDKYLSTQDRNEFAKALGLTPLQLKTWYQNRRMKWKKEMLRIDPSAVTTRAKGRPRKGEFS